MSLAEQLYRQTSTIHSNGAPPLLLYVIFIVAVSIIHIVYAAKFTGFSLGYLKAKCEEKISRSKWSESKLYLHSVLSRGTTTYINIKDNDIYTKLWVQLYLIRNILRILIFICCCIVLILYLSFVLNILYEYFVFCIVYYEDGSFLALLVLPLIWFINASIIRFLVFSMMASWSINVDHIADSIAYQQHHLSLKKYAHANDDEEVDSDDSDLNDHEIDASQATITRRTTFKNSLKGFTSDYFMAVHWRILVILCCVFATIFAVPTYSYSSSAQMTDEVEKEFTDSSWCRLLLRYLVLAMALWMTLHFCLSIVAALYGKLTTIRISNDIIDEKHTECNDSTSERMKRSLLRMFCLMDTFMIYDNDICWRNYKIIVLSLCLISGVVFIIVGCAINNGLLRFVGVINTLYYVSQILLICKIRGIHYLWRSDMVYLELKNWWHETDKDKEYQVTESHAAEMSTCLKPQDLQSLLSELDDTDVEHKDEPAIDEEKSSVILSVHDKDIKTGSTTLRSEQDVFTFYTSTHTKLYNQRRRLFEGKRTLIWYKRALINCNIITNYFHTIFKLYKIYWLLILPYHYEIRPLSMTSGKSIAERCIKYEYKETPINETMKKIYNYIWHAIRGIFCCSIFVLVVLGLLYLSIELHNVTTNYIYNVHSTNSSAQYIDHYPICTTKWNANLSVFDLTSLAHMAYEIEDNADDQIMSVQELMCLYFDRMKTDVCSWQIIDISRSSPAFIHIRHNKSETDVIAIRGTWTAQEISQDIALFNEVALLQTASWIIPITTILPDSFITSIVYFASFFEGSINSNIRARFDEPLFEYSINYVSTTKNVINSLYYVGHSLGGGIAQIVGAQMYHSYKANNILNNLEIKSFSVAAPGLVWGSRKFSIDVEDLYQTATLIKPKKDIVSSTDKYGGLTQDIDCAQQLVYKCHLTVHIICQLTEECNVYNSHNPNLIQTFCQYNDVLGQYYMGYANYSS